MAIDFLIFAVLLLSFIINLLALAAFWVTPGLRTTANRFTINLLIINLVGCLILAPTLFLTSGSFGDDSGESGGNDSLTTGSTKSGLSFLAAASANTNDDSIEFYSKPGNHQMIIRHNGKLVEQEGIILRRNVTQNSQKDGENSSRTIETIYKCNATYCRELTIDEDSETLVITEIEEENSGDLLKQTTDEDVQRLPLPLMSMRSWAIDMAAALGAMAVLLIVGDTWCAVTDPLRYHSRISGVKSWVLIAITWAMGILFGALSAFREIDFESETVITKQKRFAESSTTSFSLNSPNNIFSLAFSCLYFLLIILLPFGFVCGMYWRIFSEARENGLRMRQNGSSPLLQSALNLTQGQHQAAQQYSHSLCVHRSSVSSTSSQCGGLQMQIDNHQKRSSPACIRRDSAAKVLLPPISDDGLSDDADACSTNGQLIVLPAQQQQINPPQNNQQQQNIILTLQTASGEIKRNYSTRQLELLATSSQDLCESKRLQGIRQVHSSPNLHRSVTLPQPLNEETCSPHLLGGLLPQNLPSIHLNRHSFQQNPHNHRSIQQNHQHLHHHQSLQIPTIHASPKALSYMSSLRHRLSNASSLFKYREESRAARISILVVIMFLVSYLPFGFLVLLQCRVPAANFEESSQLAIFMILLANLSSPFIFAYRNKRVRRGVKRLVGLEAICRDSSQLQRQNSSSCRMSGGSRYNNNLKRNSSKVSTYSTNSARYLTPQSSVVSNGTTIAPLPTTTFVNHNNNCTALPLRSNSSCSAIIINNNLNKHEQQLVDSSYAADTDKLRDLQNKNINTNNKPRPVLQRGIKIIEQVPLNADTTGNTPKLPAKHKFYKLLFQSTKNLSCAAAAAAAQACAQGTLEAEEPTEV